jgi:hypothetical protein
MPPFPAATSFFRTSDSRPTASYGGVERCGKKVKNLFYASEALDGESYFLVRIPLGLEGNVRPLSGSMAGTVC